MLDTLSFTSSSVPLERIDRGDRLTDFSLSKTPEALRASIAAIGLLNPLVLSPAGGSFRVAAGHRRLALAHGMGLREVAARVFKSPESDETLLALNLIENSSHRLFSDVEKGCILTKFRRAGVSEEVLIEKYMPFLGLERSKKYCRDFLAVDGLGREAQSLLHELNIPLRVFSLLYPWDEQARARALELLGTLRPGVNKVRELLTLADECALMQATTPGDLLGREEVRSLLSGGDLPVQEKYEAIHRLLHGWRYPALSAVQKRVAGAIDRLKLDPATRVRFQDSFESDEIRVEMRFREREGWERQVKKLSQASGSPALDELIAVFRGLDK